jgi:hypothetical protein
MRTVEFLASLVLSLVLVVGCSTTITTRMVIQPTTLDQKDIIDAITHVLTDNGFDIAFVNENHGLVSTTWRPIQSGADTAASVFSALGSAFSSNHSAYSTFSRAMMISFQLLEGEYKVVPKVKHKETRTSSWVSSSEDSIEYPKPNSDEGKLVMKIINEINTTLNIPNDYFWEEKVIDVNASREDQSE